MAKKIIGLGNALADILIKIDDETVLAELGFGRGSMHLVDRAVHERIERLTEGKDWTIVSGGSAANMIRGLARLSPGCAYIGKIHDDNLGIHMEEEMKNLGVEPKYIRSGTPTGRCMVMISPDGERTMVTYLGAAVELSPEEIGAETFDGFDILHIEGYLVQDHALIDTAVRKAKQAGLIVSLDMASYNVVGENREFLERLIRESVDILFANEEESKAFTGLEPEPSVKKLAEQCSVAVVKIGPEGSLVASGGELVRIPAEGGKPLDTTGAGDLYASGFLYGVSRGLPLETCGRIGSLMASHVIRFTGPAIPAGEWPSLKKGIEELTA